jgi:predicted transcriptional regulator
MPTPHEKALAYINVLEADRQTALALSEQKAAEAKLIEARQEGFRAAMKMFGEDTCVATPEHNPKQPAQRRTRRPIPELIVRELSFSGKPMTARQVATAVDYNLERTETALRRLAEAGQVERNDNDRWELASTTTAQLGVHTSANGKPPGAAERVANMYEANRVQPL